MNKQSYTLYLSVITAVKRDGYRNHGSFRTGNTVIRCRHTNTVKKGGTVSVLYRYRNTDTVIRYSGNCHSASKAVYIMAWTNTYGLTANHSGPQVTIYRCSINTENYQYRKIPLNGIFPYLSHPLKKSLHMAYETTYSPQPTAYSPPPTTLHSSQQNPAFSITDTPTGTGI